MQVNNVLTNYTETLKGTTLYREVKVTKITATRVYIEINGKSQGYKRKHWPLKASTYTFRVVDLLAPKTYWENLKASKQTREKLKTI